jgi:hypothetical protein
LTGTYLITAKINRLDLNYLRPIHPSQERLVVDFFKQSEEIYSLLKELMLVLTPQKRS